MPQLLVQHEGVLICHIQALHETEDVHKVQAMNLHSQYQVNL